ncbi:MAG: hypothetical protein P1P84_05310 [Deferrisomatales bacterium]|nr:hypothetical protein [Deferrisomatales bacterium]
MGKLVYAILSKPFKQLLSLLFYRAEGCVPPPPDMKLALEQIAGVAVHDGPVHEVNVRVGRRADGGVEIDSGDKAGAAFIVTPQGWSAGLPEGFFRRPQGLGRLPEPVPGGSIQELWGLINIQTFFDQVLLLAVIMACLLPTGPYPILQLVGPHGSSKSTLAKILRLFIDPAAALFQSLGRPERDLAISAWNGWIFAVDNVSQIKQDASDFLCRLATGGSLRMRKLYTDLDEILLQLLRPVIVAAIPRVLVSQDAVDRSVTIPLPAISQADRLPEAVFWARVHEAAPRIFGALLDILSKVLRELPNVHLDSAPRMADFAVVGVALERAMNWEPGTFLRAFEENRLLAVASALDDDPVAQGIAALARREGFWHGRASDLLQELRGLVPRHLRKSSVWPKDGRLLSLHLRRNAPGILSLGVEINFDLNIGGMKRVIEVKWASTAEAGEFQAPSTRGAGTGADTASVDPDNPFPMDNVRLTPPGSDA